MGGRGVQGPHIPKEVRAEKSHISLTKPQSWGP